MQTVSRVEPQHAPAIAVKRLGRVAYEPTWRAMQAFTAERRADTPDELWVLEHPPVYTVGVAGREAHFPRGRRDIPVIRIDRGGQITYHGPGQVVIYLLLDMKRRGLTIRPLVRLMEEAVIDSLADLGIAAAGRIDAPGVYVGAAKIAALGLRVTRGCCYHGLAFNVDMDLSPFGDIDPCGYPGLTVTQLKDLGVDAAQELVADKLTQHLMRLLK
jgi:lipoyl(octanoyl) transferase